jgi:Zn-dependent protease|tara:strand:- start:16312 stop:17121 length:810 start_codon:yes stop_codon:yes gene_type:complete
MLNPPILSLCKFGFCSLLVAILDLERMLATLAPRPQRLQILAIITYSSTLSLMRQWCILFSMIISLLFSEPTLFFLWLLAIIYGITIHEYSHVLAAYLQGDDTGRLMGRLTLNPIAHIEPIGMILLLIVGFGWGRPAPFNPYNLKYRKWGEVIVAFAGPASNLLSIIIFMIAVSLLGPILGPLNLLIQLLSFLILINIVLLAFNLIPIPPLDGSKLLFELLPERFSHVKAQLSRNGPWILLMLIFADNFLGINIFGRVFGIFFRLAGIY